MSEERVAEYRQIDLGVSINTEDIDYRLDVLLDENPEALPWLKQNLGKGNDLIQRALDIIADERRRGGDTIINDLVWDCIVAVAKQGLAQAFEEAKQ